MCPSTFPPYSNPGLSRIGQGPLHVREIKRKHWLSQIMLTDRVRSTNQVEFLPNTLHTHTHACTHNIPKPTSMIDSTFCPHRKIRVPTSSLSYFCKETEICLSSSFLKIFIRFGFKSLPWVLVGSLPK